MCFVVAFTIFCAARQLILVFPLCFHGTFHFIFSFISVIFYIYHTLYKMHILHSMEQKGFNNVMLSYCIWNCLSTSSEKSPEDCQYDQPPFQIPFHRCYRHNKSMIQCLLKTVFSPGALLMYTLKKNRTICKIMPFHFKC